MDPQYPVLSGSRSTRLSDCLRMLLRMSVMAVLFVALHATASAQLNGSYTVGTSTSNYATISDAIDALNRNGVSGPVTFLIASGTYVPPTGGYTLSPVTGMSATNTVTFRPASGATVTISGTTDNATGVFTIDNGDYYIIDGSNTAGGTSRDMTINQGNLQYGAALFIKNDADYNVLRNTIIMSNHGTIALDLTLGGVTIFVAPNLAPAPGANGNDSNLIANNLVGDLTGTIRSHRAIYTYGGSAVAPNIGTRIIGNDVVNFGNTQGNAMGIFVSYFNNGAIVRGNTIRMTSAPSSGVTASYGIYVNESLGNGFNPTIEANTIYGLRCGSTTSQNIAGLFYACNSNNNSSTAKFINNMVSIDRGTETVTAYAFQGLLAPSNVNLLIAHNSFYIGGSSGTSFGTYVSHDGTSTITYKNNATHAPFTGSNYLLYIPSANNNGWSSSNNLYHYTAATFAYFGTTTYATLAAMQTGTGQESNSVLGNPNFINPSIANLHIHPTLASFVESRGTPLAAVPTDFDDQARHATAPDIGADEGGFNAGGLVMVAPDGGELYLGGATIPIQFTANRVLPVRVEFSTNNGATWSLISARNTTVGTNSLTFTTPDIATTQARVRVMSTLNPVEGDTSSRAFTLVQPTIQLVAPNGGEVLFQGDRFPIRWTSVDIPAANRVKLEYSTNAGGSWTEIATFLSSSNMPASNTYDWLIPDVVTNQALVRVSMLDRAVSDQSNAVFEIRRSLQLLSPNGGEQWFVGEREFVRWRVNRVNKLNIDLSTNNGTTWTNIAAGVRASLDSFQITVPNTPTQQALVRIVNAEQPQFWTPSASTFEILPQAIELTSPNGGEQFELSEPVTVTWTTNVDETLMLEYSSNGINWETIATGINARDMRYTFTPPAFPTRRALVRLTVESRPSQRDMSQSFFEILEAPGISIFNPSQDEEIMRGSVYTINWRATRVGPVNIEYSATAGSPGSWQRIASGLPAGTASFTWQVPNQTTPSGKIRILEVGGPASAESGIFSIVDPRPSVRILRPNGGEMYFAGEPIPINWTATLVTGLSLQYTDDGGASWKPIDGAQNMPNGTTSFTWTPTSGPGTRYRVRVTNGTIFDDSDNSFEIRRVIAPSVRVTAPNGGESYEVDSLVSVEWIATDITGDVTVAFSTNNGSTWTDVGTATAASGSYQWTIPDAVSAEALVRVSGQGASDQSDDVFEIVPKVVGSITITSPNSSTDIWTEGDTVTIAWDAVAVGAVNIRLSTDNGTTWTRTVATNVPATPGTYEYRVPNLGTAPLTTLMLAVESIDNSTADTTDAAFSYRPAIAGIGYGDVTGGMQLAGIFPNPFASRAEVRWTQTNAGDATLRILDETGRIARTVELGARTPGANTAVVDGGGLAAGTYLYEIRVGAALLRGTMVVVR